MLPRPSQPARLSRSQFPRNCISSQSPNSASRTQRPSSRIPSPIPVALARHLDHVTVLLHSAAIFVGTIPLRLVSTHKSRELRLELKLRPVVVLQRDAFHGRYKRSELDLEDEGQIPVGGRVPTLQWAGRLFVGPIVLIAILFHLNVGKAILARPTVRLIRHIWDCNDERASVRSERQREKASLSISLQFQARQKSYLSLSERRRSFLIIVGSAHQRSRVLSLDSSFRIGVPSLNRPTFRLPRSGNLRLTHSQTLVYGHRGHP